MTALAQHRTELIRLALLRHNDDTKALSFARQLFALAEGTEDVPRDQGNADVITVYGRRPLPVPPGYGVKPTDGPLTDAQRALWEKLARMISEHGRSPSIGDLAKKLQRAPLHVTKDINVLVSKGWLRKEGERRAMTLHILRWPAGVMPMQTIGRADVADKKGGPKSVPREAGKPIRRFDHAPINPENVRVLPADHPAVVEGRSLFQNRVTEIADSPRVLVSGANHRKLGSHVTKGSKAGFPIYALTLEERRSCPSSCAHLGDCYGNGMQWARRHKHGPELIAALDKELQALQLQHPKGFLVRLHVLGDFGNDADDTSYVAAWGAWLTRFPALHVFGYTAWGPDTPIGSFIAHLRETNWQRFAIRFSSPTPLPGGATTITRRAEGRIEEGIVCPAQTHENTCCGSCALCWSAAAKDESIVFMLHGPRAAKVPA